MITQLKQKKRRKSNRDEVSYNIMILPGIIMLIIFTIIPFCGIIIAFQNYVPAKGFLGSKWVGLSHFKYMLQIPDARQVFANTIIIAISKIIAGIIVPVTFALLFNEVTRRRYKKTIQTIVYMPHFLSWVILGSIFLNIFSLDGPINAFLGLFGVEPIIFLASNTWFRLILLLTDTWKNFGYGAIIYLAALAAIDPALYESAAMDGAGRFKQLWHITLPSLKATVVLMTTLSLGSILNAGFDQVFNMYNPAVYKTGDIIDTYVYRMGLIDMQYSLATAIGLLKSVVSFVLITISHYLADRFAGYKIF